MSIEEIEAEALKLDPKGRAKLAEKLLESLEQLSDEENARLWAEEAERRDQEWDANAGVGKGNLTGRCGDDQGSGTSLP